MIGVLKAEPHVSGTQIMFTDQEGWHHPYLQYSIRRPNGEARYVAFDTHRADKGEPEGYWFGANLNGVMSSPETKPDDLGTAEVIKQWKKRCGVDANAVFN